MRCRPHHLRNKLCNFLGRLWWLVVNVDDSVPLRVVQHAPQLVRRARAVQGEVWEESVAPVHTLAHLGRAEDVGRAEEFEESAHGVNVSVLPVESNLYAPLNELVVKVRGA